MPDFQHGSKSHCLYLPYSMNIAHRPLRGKLMPLCRTEKKELIEYEKNHFMLKI